MTDCNDGVYIDCNKPFSFTMIRMGRKLSCMDQMLKSKRSTCPENQSYERENKNLLQKKL